MLQSSKLLLLTLSLLLIANMTTAAQAQTYRRAGTEFEAMREVELPRDLKDADGKEKTPPKIVVVEFLHQGLIRLAKENDLNTANVAVVAKNGDLAPARLLQLGPGDFCRLAFEPLARQTNYEIYYGGEPPSPALLPKWSTDAGLLFESREYRNNDLQTLGSLREAFEAAVPIGADYVPSVHHANNPTDLAVRPFLSRYSGKFRIEQPGVYLFWTASQDCSFLVIDGREVVAAPGRHGPQYEARPDQAGSIQLSAGLHNFEYYHAAVGAQTMMVVAFARQPHTKDDRPALLPPEWFDSDAVLRLEPDTVTTRTRRLVPDFDYRAMGDVPLPDNPLPLVGVGFRNRSLPGMMTGAKPLWDFGDGQTSTEPSPSHVFLKPGMYTVSLTVKRGGRDETTTNRIQVDRPYRDHTTKEEAHKLDEYLPILTQYDPTMLDRVSAQQLALTYQWKSIQEASAPESSPPSPQPQADSETPVSKSDTPGSSPDKLAWLARAVDVGLRNLETPLPSPSSEQTNKAEDRATYDLAILTGSIARFDLGNGSNALAIYRAAVQKIRDRDLRVECMLRAADIANNELLDRKTAQAMLLAAEVDLGMKGIVEQVGTGESLKLPPTKPGRLEAGFFRILGDYAAAGGQGVQAQDAYRAATAALAGMQITHTQDTARRGAYSRSTEQFLKDRELDRAAREIAAWCEQFPDEKLDGYFTLLYARLFFARGQFEQAIAQCEQLATVNGASPYLDRLLLIASESQQRLGHPDRAAALLQDLIDSHPGSPLVPEAKRRLE